MSHQKKTKKGNEPKKPRPVTGKKDKVILAMLILIPSIVIITLIGIFGAVNQPFEEGTPITFQAIDFSTDENITSANVDLYYINTTGYTEQEIEEITNDMFTDFYTFDIDEEIVANGSYVYRFYVYAENYTGCFSYPFAGLNKVYLALIPTEFNILAFDSDLGVTFENTTLTNWTIDFQAGEDEGFIPFYNKTAEENSSVVIKITFNSTADVSWVDFDGSYDANKTAIDDSVYIEVYGFAFLEDGTLKVILDEDLINVDFETELIAIGYGNSNNYVELDQQS